MTKTKNTLVYTQPVSLLLLFGVAGVHNIYVWYIYIYIFLFI